MLVYFSAVVSQRRGVKRMFDNLEDQIEIAEGGQRPETTEKVMRFAGIAILSAIVFGGLCAIILALE